MVKHAFSTLFFLLVILTPLLPSLACPSCTTPSPPKKKPPPPPPQACPPPPLPKAPKRPPSPPIKPPSPPIVTPPPPPTCPIDTLKLGACVNLLGGLVNIGIGPSVSDTCCPVLGGLADLDAALCLCTAIKGQLLGLGINLPIVVEVLVGCGKNIPPGYQCPA